MDEVSSPGPGRPISLHALRSFVAICETRSFRAAASRVHCSPSAVSLQVGKLEDHLGTRLFRRDARRVALTETGETLLGFARRLLAISDEAVASLRGSPLTGQLRLMAPHDLGVSLVPRLLTRLARAHPGIVVDVRLDAGDVVQRAFAEGRAALALFNEVAAPPVAAHELGSEPLAWLVREADRAVGHEPLPLAVAEIGCAWRDVALAALQKAGRAYPDSSIDRVALVGDDGSGVDTFSGEFPWTSPPAISSASPRSTTPVPAATPRASRSWNACRRRS